MNRFLYIVIDTFGIIPASICSQFIFLSSSSLSWVFLNWSYVCFGFFPLLFWKALYFISIELTASEKFPKPVSACISAFLQYFYSSILLSYESSMCFVKNKLYFENENLLYNGVSFQIFFYPFIVCPITNGVWHILWKNVYFTLMYHVGVPVSTYSELRHSPLQDNVS